METALSQLGGVRGRDPGTWVLQGPEHWIDVEVKDSLVVHVRIAFTNPATALAIVKQVFASLMSLPEADLLNMHTKEHFQRLDAMTWSIIRQDFEARRATFRAQFGELTAPISADDVFDQLGNSGPAGRI